MANDTNGNVPAAHELESFLPEAEKGNAKPVREYYLSKDSESEEDFDPFADRNVKNPTSNTDTLIHLLKASLGTGILSMPKAFQASGLFAGVFFCVLVAVICTHCAYILIKCAHVLYKKTKKTSMSFAEVGAAALDNGPECIKKFSFAFKCCITGLLFATYFGTCSVYTVLIAENIMKVLDSNIPKPLGEPHVINSQTIMLILLPPLILMVWIRNLKYLAPVSMIANIFMGIGLGITFYFLVGTGSLNLNAVSPIKHPSYWPEFFSLTIFAMEAIGVVMPVENCMRTPRAMLGCCGVLNKGMSGVTVVYILLGFLGYLRYGEGVEDSITLNLVSGLGDPPVYNILGQVVQVCIALAVYCTFGLQFFVCVEIMWNGIKANFTKRPDFAEYVTRTIMVTLCVLLAVAVPHIAPFMGIIGAFCFSLLGLIAPAFIEIITFWDIGFGPYKYLIWKNILVVLFGLFALVFGTKDAVINMMSK
ncbi:proton-coupled amino acid transporter-like protein pathetic [Aricia agestis]|uniref:proton-coupled amino acid transporter-like protein pathetic n=1 Tax=Aricia agestis TaxID=91739 RepID=UPI001C2023ED|nr:proton-coupled amino acid transporter-like protein pathetic [Aricia agestis]